MLVLAGSLLLLLITGGVCKASQALGYVITEILVAIGTYVTLILLGITFLKYSPNSISWIILPLEILIFSPVGLGIVAVFSIVATHAIIGEPKIKAFR